MKHKMSLLAKIVVFIPIFLWLSTSVVLFYLGNTNLFYLFLLIMTFLILLSSLINLRKLNEYEKIVKENEYELDQKNTALKEQLYIDDLTQLHNLKSFDNELKKIESAKIIILNIDAFKDINEFYGKECGDFVLIEMAKKIDKFARDHDLKSYRIGADEFAFLDSSKLDISKYENIAAELVTSFRTKEIVIKELDEIIVVGTTIGLSLESEDTFSKALTALSYAKSQQKDFACYVQGMDAKDEYKDKLKYIKLIKNALNTDRVVPYFQPIFNRDGKVLKYESLARVIEENGEVISPGFFMGTSKKARLYSLMAKKIIDASFRKISVTDKTVSINLLSRDMMDSDISNYVIDKLREYNIAKQIVFEILEDESIEHLDRVANFIDRAKRMGVRIAIDDFGTGYSNFSYLLKLKPDYLKIDGSIIKNIDKDSNSEAIVKAIISFAKTLDVKTIAEFVHSKDVYDKCFELGIDEFQGFYLGKPNPDLV